MVIKSKQYYLMPQVTKRVEFWKQKLLNNVPSLSNKYPCQFFCRYCVNAAVISWWRHQMETFSALLALCAGNSPVTFDFHSLRPVTRRFDAFFNLRLNIQLSKQSWDWWLDTPSCSLWRHCNGGETYWGDAFGLAAFYDDMCCCFDNHLQGWF